MSCENVNEAQKCFKSLTVIQKVLFLLTTLIPFGFCVWALTLIGNAPWSTCFIWAAVLSMCCTFKVLNDQHSDGRITVARNALLGSLVTFIAISLWCGYTLAPIADASACALCNLGFAYPLVVLGTLGIVGWQICDRKKSTTVLFLLGGIFFLSNGFAFFYSGIANLIVLPEWLCTAFHIATRNISKLTIISGLIFVTIKIAKISTTNKGFAVCKWCGSVSLGLISIVATYEYLCVMFNLPYNINISGGIMLLMFCTMFLCGISAFIGIICKKKSSK